jgi:hypothetical protein
VFILAVAVGLLCLAVLDFAALRGVWVSTGGFYIRRTWQGEKGLKWKGTGLVVKKKGERKDVGKLCVPLCVVMKCR